jgi:hypothetical protein
MTSLLRRLICACVLVAAVAGLPSSPAQSALLCGNRWVNTTYVLPNNCLKACLNAHHTVADCTTTLVPLCQSCWRRLTVCAADKAIPPAEHCKVCTDVYANCMKPFF